jgi:hypothetical protein
MLISAAALAITRGKIFDEDHFGAAEKTPKFATLQELSI